MRTSNLRKLLIAAYVGVISLASAAVYSFSGPIFGGGAGGGGGAAGPANSTDNAIVRWDGTQGNLLQDSTIIASDVGALSGVNGLSMSGLSTFVGGAAVTGASYQIGRDADATNQLHFNVPTGSSFEFSVNDAPKATLTSGALTLDPLLTFNNTAHAITNSAFQLGVDTQIGGAMRFNAPSGSNFTFSINGTIEASLNSSNLNLLDNNVISSGKLAFGPDAQTTADRFVDLSRTITTFPTGQDYFEYTSVNMNPPADSGNGSDSFVAHEYYMSTDVANTHKFDFANFSNAEYFFNHYGSGDLSNIISIWGGSTNEGSGNITFENVGGYFRAYNNGSGDIGGTCFKCGNFAVAAGTANRGSGNIPRDYVYYAESPYFDGTGLVDKHWGMYFEDQELGTESWAIQTAGGKIEFGAPTGKNSLVYLSDDDVAHGMTSLYPTNVYSVDTVISATAGGRKLVGLSDSDAAALQLTGVIGASSPTATTPAINLIGAKKNGTTDQSLGNSDTLLYLSNNGGTPAISVLGNNSVGIGKTTPSVALDVVGSITSSATVTGSTVTGSTITSPGAGSLSEKFGASTTAAGTSSVAIGNSASAVGDSTVAIGASTVAGSGSTNTIIIGAGISTTSGDSVTIGTGASNWSQSVGIGRSVNPGGNNSVSIGRQAGGGTQTVMIGDSAGGSGTHNIGIGYNVSVTGSGGATDSIGIGANVVTGFGSVICLGSSCTGTAANQFVVGSSTASVSDMYIGKGVAAASPSSITIHATGGNGSGINGGDLKLAGGIGGAAADTGGSIIFQTADSGAGTTLSNRLTISPAGDSTFTGKVTSSRTTDIGWSIVSASNQACNTTCTSACVHGWDTSIGEVAVDCTDATADKCLCAGAN